MTCLGKGLFNDTSVILVITFGLKCGLVETNVFGRPSTTKKNTRAEMYLRGNVFLHLEFGGNKADLTPWM